MSAATFEAPRLPLAGLAFKFPRIK